MSNKYFDEWEFRQALDQLDSNPYDSAIRLEQYVSKYPKDYSMHAYYAYSLITIGQHDKAKAVLDNLEKEAFVDGNFLKQKRKVELVKRNIIFSRIRLLSYTDKYDDLYKFYLSNMKTIKDMDINTMDFYIKMKAGLLDPSKRDHGYLFRQIVEYKESDFLDHVQKHLSEFNAGKEEPNKNIFSSEFPFEKVLEEIKKHFLSSPRLNTGFFEDSYIFKYDGCGRADDRFVDYFRVICFHNTKNIITMCPVPNMYNVPFIDLNYISEEKPKKISQIDRFNKRFKL